MDSTREFEAEDAALDVTGRRDGCGPIRSGPKV
jgi:hypothetical protein